MSDFKNQMISVLNSIEVGSSFCCTGSIPQILPGLHIESYGEVSFPLNGDVYKDLVNYARQAPFGQGSKTITNVSVRRSHEIDAEKISFKNPQWNMALTEIVEAVKEEFAIENKILIASLYKMLLYHKGDFFLPHKDSEKEKGMFATLVIGLPSKHTGGELVVEFSGQKQIVNFSEAIDLYKLPYTAFYADCQHEIKPLTSGYRTCLVYNLIQINNENPIKSPAITSQVNQLSKLLSANAFTIKEKPIVILLDHQYTPANFSNKLLKRKDVAKVKTIFQACEQSGYYAKLALLTCYQMGDSLSDYDYRYEPEGHNDGVMGDIFEDRLEVEHWTWDDIPDLGNINVEPEQVISDYDLKDGDPLEVEEEGYTGNAGMTVEYWYHYGAVVLWPKSQQLNILENRGIKVKLDWLTYFLYHKELLKPADLKSLLTQITETEFYPNSFYLKKLDLNIILEGFITLNDISLAVKDKSFALFTKIFAHVKTKIWITFFETYPQLFDKLISAFGNSKDAKSIEQLTLLLKSILENKSHLTKSTLARIKDLPNFLNQMDLYKQENYSEVKTILDTIIDLSNHAERESFISELVEVFTNPEFASRHYVNKVLVKTLLKDLQKKNTFSKALYHFCIKNLKNRTKVKPTPPKNWSRSLPVTKDHQRQWQILKDFIESPTHKVFDYTIKQSDRTAMEDAIENVVIDLKYETIKKKSPYTLRITKTQKAYEKELKEWHEDKELLESLSSNFI